MAKLYTNISGKPVTLHSYSAGNDWHYCKRRYKLGRIDGWKEKEDKASLEFGNCIEAGIQFFFANKKRPNSSVEEFSRLWKKLENNPVYTYTEKEGSWQDLFLMGSEMMRLFEATEPSLPFDNPRFQLNYKKEVLPGTKYAGVDYSAYIDMRCDAPFNHPKLSKIKDDAFIELRQQPKIRQLLVDIKTSGSSLNELAGLLTLDPQLRSYAWVTGIQDVSFLWFVKTRPNIKRSDIVTVLGAESIQTGTQMVVLDYDDEGHYYLLNDKQYEEFQTAVGNQKGKKREEIVKRFKQKAFILLRSNLTKQKLQFISVRIPADDIIEAGQAIAQEIAEIVNANEKQSYPKEPGVRFPNNVCLMCPFLGLCSNNPELVKEKLVNIKTLSAPEKDWMDTLGE